MAIPTAGSGKSLIMVLGQLPMEASAHHRGSTGLTKLRGIPKVREQSVKVKYVGDIQWRKTKGEVS